MKKKIVLWGNDAEDKKILIGIELIDEDNAVKIYTYDEQAATQQVYDTLMSTWRTQDEAVLPEGYQVRDRPLSVSDDLLPEDIKVERTDLISRAKAEWHFIVLSSKLHQMYASELEDFKDKIDGLEEYSEAMWEEMKSFWTKVQEQVQDKNLFREHAAELRAKTNNLFEKLKSLKKTFQTEFKKKSSETAAKYKAELEEIEAKIEKGLGLKPIFDQLKGLQSRFRNEKFTREDQRKLWNKIDATFKTVKEKRFGDKPDQQGGAVSRVERRYKGLMGAIEKMQRSIGRDNKDLEWENKRIAKTDGQLEMQIRQAKLVMINERIASKQEKLDDMLKTKVELEGKIEKEKKKEEARAAKAKAKEVQSQVKQKIAAEIAQAKEAREGEDDKLKALAADMIAKPKVTDSKATATEKDGEAKEAAAAVNEQVEKEESLIEEATSQISAAVGNVVDTVKAVADVVEDKVEAKFDAVKDKVEDFKNDPETQDKLKEVKTGIASVIGSAAAVLSDVVDKVEELADKVEDQVEDIVDKVTGDEEE